MSELDLTALTQRLNCFPLCDCGRHSTQRCADGECGAEACDGHARKTGALGHQHRWVRYPLVPEDVAAVVAEVKRLQKAVRAARKGGAEAMREACSERCAAKARALGPEPGTRYVAGDHIDDLLSGRQREASDLAVELRAVPLPDGDGAEDDGRAAAQAAEEMRQACDDAAVRVTNAWARGERVGTTPGLAALACGEEITERIRSLKTKVAT